MSDKGKELVLRNGGELSGRGDGIAMLKDSGGIICYDKEVV